MKRSTSNEQIVCMKFDSFVKKCCKNELRDIEKYRKRIWKNELSFSDIIELRITDVHTDLDVADFVVDGHEIRINSEKLVIALGRLSPRERELILLIYFIGYKPREVSDNYNVRERTVFNWRNKILEKLKEFMEETDE